MSETSEVATARRNLLIIASTIFIVEAAGATIKSINAPGVTIDIKRPELIIYFLYSALIYSLFRFWQLAKPHYSSHSYVANPFINHHPIIKSAVKENSFGLEGVNLSDYNPSLKRGIFKREVYFSGHSEGRGINRGPVRVPYLKLMLAEVVADIRAIPARKDFVEYTFPILYTYLVFLGKAGILLIATICG